MLKIIDLCSSDNCYGFNLSRAETIIFKGMMNQDENICIIQTPGLRKEIVQSILCLFYCGKVSVTWELLNDINESFKTLGEFIHNLLLCRI